MNTDALMLDVGAPSLGSLPIERPGVVVDAAVYNDCLAISFKDGRSPNMVAPGDTGVRTLNYTNEAGQQGRLIAGYVDGKWVDVVFGAGAGIPELANWWRDKIVKGRLSVRYPMLAQEILGDRSDPMSPLAQARKDGERNLAPHRRHFYEEADEENRTKQKLSLYLRGLLSGKLWVYNARSAAELPELLSQINRMKESGIRFELDDSVLDAVIIRSPDEAP